MYAKQIKQLRDLQKKINNGRGLRCVDSIITYLEMEDYDNAKAIRQWDGDKTRSYPEMEKKLYKIFGCRLHGKKKCSFWLCKE